MHTINAVETFYIEHCCNCGLAFGMENAFRSRKLGDKTPFYCPAGHRQWYLGKSDADRIQELKAQVASKDDLLQSERVARQKANAEVQTQFRLRRAAEGKTRAVKKRVAAGVCPCCTRTFQNLLKHMAGQHPGYAKGDGQ